MDVLYSINGKYLDIMMASFLSLYKNGGFKKIRLHVIVENFSIHEIRRLNDFIELLEDVELCIYPMENFDIEKYRIPKWSNSQICNSRLFFETILKDNISSIENLLYLDADTIVKDNLYGLNEYKDAMICAVKDQCLKSYIRKFVILNDYFNSGVLFINVKEWIKNNAQERIIDFLNNNDVKLDLPDQDIINCSFNGHITELPLEYNMLATPYAFNDILNKLYFNPKIRNISYEEIMKAIKEPKVLHAYGFSQMKPWTNNDVNPFNEDFMKYILEVNPEFEKMELTLFRKIITTNKTLFFTLLALKPYLPENVENKVHKLLLKINN